MNKIKEYYLRLFKGYELISSFDVQKERLLNHPKNKEYELIKVKSRKVKFSDYWKSEFYIYKKRENNETV